MDKKGDKSPDIDYENDDYSDNPFHKPATLKIYSILVAICSVIVAIIVCGIFEKNILVVFLAAATFIGIFEMVVLTVQLISKAIQKKQGLQEEV